MLGTVLADHTPPVRHGRPGRAPGGRADRDRRDRVHGRRPEPRGRPRGRAAAARRARPGARRTGPSPGASGPGRVAVRLPAVGLHSVTVRVSDRLGNVAVSAPITVRLPTAAQAADARVSPTPSPGRFAGEAPGAAVAWAHQQARRFHAQPRRPPDGARARRAHGGRVADAPRRRRRAGLLGLHELRRGGVPRPVGDRRAAAPRRCPPPGARRGGRDDLASRR